MRVFASEVVIATAEVLAQLEGHKVEASYDAEIIRAAFESGKETWVFLRIGVADGAVGEDNFEVGDKVTPKAVRGPEVRYAA